MTHLSASLRRQMEGRLDEAYDQLRRDRRCFTVHVLAERGEVVQKVAALDWLDALRKVARDDAAVAIQSPHPQYPEAVAAVRLTANGRQSFVLGKDADEALSMMRTQVLSIKAAI
ncbi:hypothetical protein [Halomonas sp. 707B3]|uniref:hypothetical protein n=1 Tax=Halomonas sp. 707B3 TaxID=1681043 RepID=UPI00209D89F2|nr:hypothetical protein [Halomonas sp. 707B3]MCP1317857.1 hypothetical protein [Halomonas sp. 707B3]